MADAASAVLTNRSLFVLVASFLPGLPRVVVDFAAQHRRLLPNYWYETGLYPCLAAEARDFAMLQRLYRLHQEQSSQRRSDKRLAFDGVMTHTAERGNLEALRWLSANTGIACEPTLLQMTATMGRVEVVKWLVENRKDACASVTMSPCDAIVFNGDLELTRLLASSFPRMVLTSDAMDYAAAQGYFDIVRYLHETRSEGCSTAAMDHAARCGRLDIVQFLHENRHEGCTEQAMDFAAANGHLEVVRFLHDQRHEGCTTSAMDDAAANGHLEMVRFLHENRTEGCSMFAVYFATSNRRLNVLEYLFDHRRELFTRRDSLVRIDEMAAIGAVRILQFLHERIHDSSYLCEDAMYEACRCGHVEIVQYLVEHCGRVTLERALLVANENNQKSVAKFLMEKRYGKDGNGEGCTEETDRGDLIAPAY